MNEGWNSVPLFFGSTIAKPIGYTTGFELSKGKDVILQQVPPHTPRKSIKQLSRTMSFHLVPL